MMRTVTVIPPKRKEILKVAAYCRVSTNYPEQYESLESQVKYFTDFINSTPNWELAKIYVERASGIYFDKRDEFNRMIQDCKDGKIDMILTKNIQRFGRNTVDSIKTLRELKYQDVNVYFDAEKIDSMDEKVSFGLGMNIVMSQTDSEIQSKNIKWGIRRSMEKGHVKLNHTQFLGYTRDENGKLVIVPAEAETVKLIYRLYLNGCGVRKIKKHLENNGIKTVTGKSEWSTSTIDRILSNEKYIGNAIQQKTYVADFINGKQVKNEGQVEQVLIENSHEAIIDQEIWDGVQKRKAGRVNKNT